MHLSVDDRTGESATLSDGIRTRNYRRAGLSVDPPDARYSPGRTEVAPYLRDAVELPGEINVEFVHSGTIYRFVVQK